MEFCHFTPEDYEAVCAFLIALNRQGETHINWNWARFEWMYEHPEFDKSLLHSIGLWRDGGAVVGAAIYDMYFGEAFCAVLPGYPGLFDEVLDYAYRSLKDENGLAIALCDSDQAAIDAAAAKGFAPIEQTETMLRIELDGTLPVTLPDGFCVRELDPGEDITGFQWLLWQGFDHGSDYAEFAKEDPIDAKRRPHFDPRLSLTATDPTGRQTAYCCLWYRADTDYAYVEPVCTVPAFRKKGIAGAILSAALNRAHALGAKRAYVISDQSFYKNLGFAEAAHFTFYKKQN